MFHYLSQYHYQQTKNLSPNKTDQSSLIIGLLFTIPQFQEEYHQLP